MNLALSILFLWLGAMLLAVAFHPLASGSTTPSAVLESIQNKIKATPSAYDAA